VKSKVRKIRGKLKRAVSALPIIVDFAQKMLKSAQKALGLSSQSFAPSASNDTLGRIIA